MNKKIQICPWSNCCRNGGDGCFAIKPELCVRYLPLEGNNLTEINFIIETPPNVDSEKFSQYFSNWIECMGWSYSGIITPYTDDDSKV